MKIIPISISFTRMVNFLGVCGIIGSLVFVGLELRQSHRIALAAQQQQRAALITEVIGSFSEARPAISFLTRIKCKKIVLGCTELPIAIFAFKSFKKIKSSKTFLDPNLILAQSAMAKHKN